MWIIPLRRLAGSAVSGAAMGVACMQTDLSYYRHRQAEEISAASVAADAKVSAVHAELALRYGERIRSLEQAQRGIELHLVSAA